MKTILICGGAGFIGHKVIVADIKDRNEYSDDYYDEYECMDLTLESSWQFIKEFKLRESEYLKKGGKFIVPCPEFYIVEDKND